MGGQDLEEIGLALASGYPSSDSKTNREFQGVVELALPSLALRAASAMDQGKEEVEEVWKSIREDSEGLFEGALENVDRVKVIYVASKFANNKMVGELMTKLAMDVARSKKGD